MEAQCHHKVDLQNISKLPAKEFEKHFHDWMERDDVARALQAKLRSDLIQQFNKTSLGRQILLQTASTSGGYGPSQRLTLSPLVLAINTLVGEFLYAQNCHFTLSVYCSEVPFRNTLPEFESVRKFRFSNAEINDLMEALFAPNRCNMTLNKTLQEQYAKNANASFLLLFFKLLIGATISADIKDKSVLPVPAADKNKNEPAHAKKLDEFEGAADLKSEIYNSNFRYLNKYLIILAKNVKQLCQEIKNWQKPTVHNQPSMPHVRMGRPISCRRYENLTRSLERITKNLRQMSHDKRTNKHVNAILTALTTLSNHFENFAVIVETTRKERVSKRPTPIAKPPSEAPKEKTYADWVQEMRTTPNGQKFLDKVEVSLRKALNKQRECWEKETQMKLLHQKELLRIRYKQKLLEITSSRRTTKDYSEANCKIDRQLRELEKKHLEFMDKVLDRDKDNREAAEANRVTTMPEVINVQPSVAECSKAAENILEHGNLNSTVETLQTSTPKNVVTIDYEKEAQKSKERFENIVNNMTAQERNIEHIVSDSRLHIQQLENESNQLDIKINNYLERTKLEMENGKREVAAKLWQDYNCEQQKLPQKYGLSLQRANENQTKHAQITSNEAFKFDEEATAELEKMFNSPDEEAETMGDWDFEIKNAITEAKEKFFEGERKYIELIEQTNLMPEILEEDNESKYWLNRERHDQCNRTVFVLQKGEVNKQAAQTQQEDNPPTPISELNLKDQTLDTEIDVSSTQLQSTTRQTTSKRLHKTQAKRQLSMSHDEEQYKATDSESDDSYEETSKASLCKHKTKYQQRTKKADQILNRKMKPLKKPKMHLQKDKQTVSTTTTTTTTNENENATTATATATATTATTSANTLKQSMEKMQKLFSEQSEQTERSEPNDAYAEQQLESEYLTEQTRATISSTTINLDEPSIVFTEHMKSITQPLPNADLKSVQKRKTISFPDELPHQEPASTDGDGKLLRSTARESSVETGEVIDTIRSEDLRLVGLESMRTYETSFVTVSRDSDSSNSGTFWK